MTNSEGISTRILNRGRCADTCGHIMSKRFARFANRRIPQFAGDGNRIFILTTIDAKQFRIRVKQTVSRNSLTNLAGIIRGKSRPEEYVIFSAHYDHLGIGLPDAAGDSILQWCQ